MRDTLVPAPARARASARYGKGWRSGSHAPAILPKPQKTALPEGAGNLPLTGAREGHSGISSALNPFEEGFGEEAARDRGAGNSSSRGFPSHRKSEAA